VISPATRNTWRDSASDEAAGSTRHRTACELSRYRAGTSRVGNGGVEAAARPPLLTCEPVLTEAAFLLKREGRDTDPLFALLDRGVIRIGLSIQEQQADLRALMRRYRNRPMSLADACLVRLSEIHAGPPNARSRIKKHGTASVSESDVTPHQAV
jgi:hypothetical protein